jgi:DNA-binding LacI/PurR family transcriptional regulator
MGAIAVRRLRERASDPEGPPQRIILGVKLIERESIRTIQTR